jgi:hypothetical protein
VREKPRQDPTPERLEELAAEGALGAATAFAQLVDRPLLARQVRRVGAEEPLPASDWASGVFFQVEGDLRGHVALLLSAQTRDALPESLVVELGNIVASRAVSAIADGIGGRIVLSIPSLMAEHPARELAGRAQRLAAGSSGARIELAFEDPGGALRALLVLLPALEG